MKIFELFTLLFFWVVIFMCPLFLLAAVAFSGCILFFGGDTTVSNWGLVLLSSAVSGVPAGVLTSEYIRREYGLVEFYAKLMNNKELNSKISDS
ncbi:TPA: hypothetical protein P2Q98_002959 [Aeromonas veronii]|uniref:hypothetical protein n=1 Tax=Aeromonas veronii TaxID=654 RepID=UPI00330FFE32|nr:hypothetical protein [Aeromonas veronii]HDO1334750.1 hypothetical protein [Aeromonas veronii]HDO1337135.1 hypothetical protein [Aeromonas veronii]HDO1342360.1 hypothetical protein [Aeromonas veronii]HDO1346699.1 hypothetical protein [Aeromonas veronii]